jgi:RND family efflux transporter MFP subunit
MRWWNPIAALRKTERGAARFLVRLAVCAVPFALVTISCRQVPDPRAQASSRRILFYQDPMHPSYKSGRPGIAPDCNMPLVPVYAEDDGGSEPSRIHLNPAQEQAIGLQTETVLDEAGAGEVRALGRVQAEESRTFKVTAGVDGWIRNVRGGETGSFVAKGQALASYYSRDIYSPQQAYLYAKDSLDRIRVSKAATPEQTSLADKQLKQARDYLEFIGMTGPQIADLEHSGQESREVTLGAPVSGVVLERRVSEGTRFSKGEVLWEIADIRSVWVAAELFQEDLAAVAGARTATVGIPGGGTYQALIDSSLPRFESTDRVAKLRLTARNPGYKLLPGMVVEVLLPKPLSHGITVSAEAVVGNGIRPRVFVRDSSGELEARAVTTGWQNAGRVQILSGLKAGERVVTSGAFLIDSESRMNQRLP